MATLNPDVDWDTIHLGRGRHADLGGADLGGADLGGADLSRAYLYGAVGVPPDVAARLVDGRHP